VTCPSGTLVLIDGGMLGLWSHDRAPWLDPDEWGAQVSEIANHSVDLRASGPDALEAVQQFDHASGRGRYVFDVPQERVLDLQQQFGQFVVAHGLEASLEVLAARVPHRTRVTELVDGPAALAEIPFHGMWAVACSGLPRDRPLEISGRRVRAPSPVAGRWSCVWLQVSPAPVFRSEPAVTVLVDRARLMFADADALGAWQQEQALDGLADVVFWGRDAEEVAAQLGSPRMVTADGPIFGWTDLPGMEAIEKAEAVVALRTPQRKFALDFRPHSHAYQLMAQVRATETESGQVEVGGAELCGFATSWGDGAFEVVRDLDRDGGLVRVRIQMETPERTELLRKLNRR
jgi:hypothetical protein